MNETGLVKLFQKYSVEQAGCQTAQASRPGNTKERPKTWKMRPERIRQERGLRQMAMSYSREQGDFRFPANSAKRHQASRLNNSEGLVFGRSNPEFHTSPWYLSRLAGIHQRPQQDSNKLHLGVLAPPCSGCNPMPATGLQDVGHFFFFSLLPNIL